MILQDKQIFIIEDDATNLAIISSILRRNGATVSYDRWGRETIERIIKAMPIDIILLDLMLPNGVSGYDIFEQIKATPELNGLPVVAVSASDPGIEMNRARQKGLMGFISKPVDHKRFPHHIATIIEGTPFWGDQVYP